ncbi:hypothetical protein AB0O01_30225 [Streptomyces sp. NPDC093252]|uniref:hypothetical protein n=1 Tax=Streptomyces sp. NPDC093252 TaxID=3154980 RepID=UPI0034433352
MSIPPQNPYGQQPTPDNPYGQPPPPGSPYGQQPPVGDPYGQQPPSDNPYGQPPSPGHAYGQPPPQPPGAYPQPPAYGDQPYGQPTPPPPPQGGYGQPQQPWGAPPMGPPAPPPRKKRTALILGIVGGVVALVVVVVAGLALIGNEVVEDAFPEAEYQLTLPQTLLDDTYELSEDMSDTQGRAIEDEAEGAWDAKDATAVVATYSLGGDEAAGTLIVSGMYGRFLSVDANRDNMMDGAAAADGMEVAVPPQDFTPGDSGITITCEVLTQTSMGTEMSIPTCGWMDGNTGATVAEVTPELIATAPEDVDLEAAAASALKIREEMRRPIG